MREYDIATERIRPEVVDDKDCILLVNHRGEEGGAHLMAETIPFANLLDDTRFFEVSLISLILFRGKGTRLISRSRSQCRTTRSVS